MNKRALVRDSRGVGVGAMPLESFCARLHICYDNAKPGV